MKHIFLGQIELAVALQRQEQAVRARESCVFGFECAPVITLGRRASAADVVAVPAHFTVVAVDRGGQATLHNPGQLVIFPVCEMRGLGARAWIESLWQITQNCLLHWGIQAQWNPLAPGLYTSRGKIMACGVRLKDGFSRHGLAINVCNELSDFAFIRACGVSAAPMDRIGGAVTPAEVFALWMREFSRRPSQLQLENA